MIDQKEINYLINFRKQLHQNPELSGKETKTAKAIVNELKKYDPIEIITNVGGEGVIAFFGDKKASKTLLFRSELDALPIQEVNTFKYRSNVDGISHKCGHDGHSTILVGLAKIISKSNIKGVKVILLFQPAEENGDGAKAILSDKKFRQIKPDYVFALHNVPGYDRGTVIVRENAFTPAVSSIKISLKGKTSHAAEPEFGINPDMAIHELIQNIKALDNNKLNSDDFGVITTVYAQLGSEDYGISAGSAELHFTIRCWTVDKLNSLKKSIEKDVASISQKNGLTSETKWFYEFMPNINDGKAVELIKSAVKSNNYNLLIKEQPFKWGEDFGLFTQHFKGAMFALGAGKNAPALHNPDYDFPDELIPLGISMFFSIIESINA